jgi:hypothetical protein
LEEVEDLENPIVGDVINPFPPGQSNGLLEKFRDVTE